MTLQFTQITGSFEDGQGNALSGVATFTPNTTVYAAGVPVVEADVPIVAQIIAGALKNSSGGTLQLLATDNTGISYAGQTGFLMWTVSITLSGQVLPSWSFFLPHTPSPVDLFALANTAAGGFVSPMTTLGDMITGGTSGAAARLAGNTASAREFLVSLGSGGLATAPAWSALQAGDIPQLADYAPTGLTGATAASRYAGATASGAPVSGTFATGDFVIDQAGKVWICTAAGTPGTWTAAGPTIPVTISQGGTGQTSAPAALAALGGASVAGDLANTSASPQVTGTHLASPLPLAQGGTSGASQQAAINALTGTQAAGKVLRSDGTNAALANIQAGDVPVLNQNTTGTAAGLSATLGIGSGGTGQVTQQAAIDALAGAVTASQFPRGNGTHVVMSSIQEADFSGPFPWQFYVSNPAYGAKGNCRIVTDGVMSSSVTPTVLTCATSTPFVSGDVGKSVTVTGAGAAGVPLTTTIASFTDSGHVTLAVAASTTVSGASVTYGTDDTAAVNAALAAAYAYAAANHGYAEILLDPVTYLIAGATSAGTLGVAGQCKAQIPLPVTAVTAQKVTLVFRGTRDASALYHWQQTTPQQAGAVLATTLNANAQFGAIGTEPSVIGGPLPVNGYGAGTSLFANDLIVLDGITILTPANPLICGFDFRGMAEANVISASVLVNAGGGLIGSIPAPAQGGQFGLAMPQTNNNDDCNVQMYSCEGQNYGLIASEHTVIWSMRAIYCTAGLVCTGAGGSTPHSMLVHYVSCEACQIAVQFNYSSASPTKVRILCLDYESGSGNFGNFNIINDPGNYGTGEICIVNISAATPRTATFDGGGILNGGSGLQVRALDLPLGHITAPSVPSTTTALLNGSGANAAVTVSGGTVTAITVDGTATGITSGTVIVPANKTIAVAYSVVPSWNWVLF